MADIRFRNTAHRDFFLENMMKCRLHKICAALHEDTANTTAQSIAVFVTNV